MPPPTGPKSVSDGRLHRRSLARPAGGEEKLSGEALVGERGTHPRREVRRAGASRGGEVANDVSSARQHRLRVVTAPFLHACVGQKYPESTRSSHVAYSQWNARWARQPFLARGGSVELTTDTVKHRLRQHVIAQS